MSFFSKVIRRLSGSGEKVIFDSHEHEIHELKTMIGRQLVFSITDKYQRFTNIQDAEFKVFSQFGDDGIIQYLINRLNITNRTFVEFGVENYKESNTRFLLVNNNWRGLVMDGSAEHIAELKDEEIYWKYNLTAVCSFITSENINDILRKNNFSGEIGILNIDVDGNDYWIWEAIDSINPILVIVEYNSVFGPEKAVTIPYKKDFVRSKAHYSWLYWGCSLMALNVLADKKGYGFVGSNSNGNNAYFVRKDHLGEIKAVTVKEGYVESMHRESRNENKELTFLNGSDRIKEIKDCEVFDVLNGKTDNIKNIFKI